MITLVTVVAVEVVPVAPLFYYIRNPLTFTLLLLHELGVQHCLPMRALHAD